MAKVVVWSEREPLVGWHDCWVSGALMTLVYGGFSRFPLGLYADAEREALERPQTGLCTGTGRQQRRDYPGGQEPLWRDLSPAPRSLGQLAVHGA